MDSEEVASEDSEDSELAEVASVVVVVVVSSVVSVVVSVASVVVSSVVGAGSEPSLISSTRLSTKSFASSSDAADTSHLSFTYTRSRSRVSFSVFFASSISSRMSESLSIPLAISSASTYLISTVALPSPDLLLPSASLIV